MSGNLVTQNWLSFSGGLSVWEVAIALVALGIVIAVMRKQ